MNILIKLPLKMSEMPKNWHVSAQTPTRIIQMKEGTKTFHRVRHQTCLASYSAGMLLSAFGWDTQQMCQQDCGQSMQGKHLCTEPRILRAQWKWWALSKSRPLTSWLVLNLAMGTDLKLFSHRSLSAATEWKIHRFDSTSSQCQGRNTRR